MTKFCVFCGRSPIRKTKEHVFPLWLIQLSGEPKRPLKLRVPHDPSVNLPTKISFDSLHFPACKRCNSRFSEVEGEAKGTVEKMLKEGTISCKEIHVFLDWLDKVRTGLWLGALYLGNNPFEIRPLFYVSSRVGGKDRMVVIYRAPVGPKGLSAIGFTTPLFLHHPVCFSLWINHLCFLNVSTDFLISRRLGFPHPATTFFDQDGLPGYEIAPGRERAMLPLVKFNYSTLGTEIFQSIFHQRLSRKVSPGLANLYEAKYVKRFSMLHESGIGKPLIQEGQSLRPYPDTPATDWLPAQTISFDDLLRLSVEQTLRIQARLVDDAPIPRAATKLFNRLRNLNGEILKKFQKGQD